jgi:predicted amidohydrolase
MEDVDTIQSRSWTEEIKAGSIQTELHLGDIDANLGSAARLIEDCTEKEDPDLLVLPEVFATGFPYDTLEELILRSDEVIGTLSDLSRDRSVSLIFTQVVEDEDRFFNRLFLMGSDGRIKGKYDKTHLFSRAGEDRFFTPGNRLVLLREGNVGIGPLICYEVRFPELSRKLIMSGASLLVYPAQWPAFRTFQWETLLKARAIENQCFVIGTNIFGNHGNSSMGGSSRIYSPFGNTIASVDQGEGWSVCRLDPDEMYSLREKIPVLREARTDLTF